MTDHTAEPSLPKRRIRECVESWPGAETGTYDPRCCRWPKSCSATTYDPDTVAEDELEPLAQGGIVEDPEANGLATHLCSFDGCYPAPCADHLSTAGAALKWLANRRVQTAQGGIVTPDAQLPALFGFDPRDRIEAAAMERAYRKGLVDAQADAAAAFDRGRERGKAEGIAEGAEERAKAQRVAESLGRRLAVRFEEAERLRAEIERLQVLLEQAEQYARDLQDENGWDVTEEWALSFKLNGDQKDPEYGGHVFDSREDAARHLAAWRQHYPDLTYTDEVYHRRVVLTGEWQPETGGGQDGQ